MNHLKLQAASSVSKSFPDHMQNGNVDMKGTSVKLKLYNEDKLIETASRFIKRKLSEPGF